jgi:hypothetical protein
MEMDDEQEIPKKRAFGALPGIRCPSRALAQVPRIRCARGSPQLATVHLCLRLFGLSRPGLPQVLFCRRFCLVEMCLLLRDVR